MALHEISFAFDGGHASKGRMAAVDATEFYAGSRRLLAREAHFFCTGSVAFRAMSRREGYELLVSAPRLGSWEVVWQVSMTVAEWAAAGVVGGIGFEIARVGWKKRHSFGDYIRSRLDRLVLFSPGDAAIEPLQATLWNRRASNAPMLRLGLEIERSLLDNKGRQAIIQLASAIGRSAETLRIDVDGVTQLEIDRGTVTKLITATSHLTANDESQRGQFASF